MANKEVAVGLKITGDAAGGIKAAKDTSAAVNGITPAAQRATQAAGSLDRQFAKLGIRSANQINADILEINQALINLAKRADLTGDEFDRAFAQGQRRLAALKREAAGGGAALDDVGRRANNLSAMMGRLALAFSGLELARQFVTVNAELENVERTFNAVAGSAEAAAREMDFARDVAARLGLEQVATARSYASLMAATKGTAAEGEKSRQVFESVARAMSLAGKSSAETEGALLALQQMASKGVVSMEELRQQLGERLPGALNAVADGFGITTAQLIQLVEAGQMTAEELFPALSAGLNKLYKDSSAETLVQEWNHFKTAIQDAYTSIGDAGAVELLKGALESMEAVVFGVSTGIVALGKNIGTLLGALANGDIGLNGFSENAKRAFAEIEEEVRKKTVNIALHNSQIAAGLDDTGKMMLENARAQNQAADVAVSGWTRLNVAFNTVKTSGAAATEQAAKHAEAVKAEGAAAVESANALGGEADRRMAAAKAATANAAALAELAERRREESAMATEHVARMREEAEAAGGATEQQQKVIDNLAKLAEARQADADKATAQAAQSQMAAVRAEVEAKAYENARGELSKWSAIKEAALSVDQATIRLAIEQQRTIAAVAKEKGNERQATQALLEIKRLEIKLAELTAKAKQAEAEAILAGVRAAREALAAAGELTEAKKAELAAAEAGAEVKRIEAQIAGETAKRMHELADVTTVAGGQAASAARGYGDLAESLRDVSDAANAAAAAQGQMETRTPQIGVSADPMAEFYKRGATIDEAKAAEKYYQEFYRRNEVERLSQGFSSYQDMARQTSQAIGDAVEKALAAGRAEIASGSPVDTGTPVADIVQQMSANARISSPSDQGRLMGAAGRAANAQPVRRVQIDLRSETGNTRLFADDDAAADTFIRMLERDARRSS